MNSNLSKLITAAGLVAACSALPVLVAPAVAGPKKAPEEEVDRTDTVVILEGGKEKTFAGTTVKSADYAKVVYDYKNRPKESGGHTVTNIVWGDAPREYARGWLAVRKGDGAAGVREFKSSLQAFVALEGTDLEIRPWINEYASIGLGESLRLAAGDDAEKLGEAIAAYDKGLAKNAKSLLTDVALAGKAQAYLSMAKASDASRVANELKNAGRSARRPLWELRGLELLAQIQTTEGRHADASRAYKEVEKFAESALASAASSSEKEHLAAAQQTAAARGGWVLLDKAVASKSGGDFQTAKAYFDALAGKYRSSRPVMAAVTNAYGVIEFEKSGGDKLVALRLFEEAEVRYFGDQFETARSLYYQARCLEELGDKEGRQLRLDSLQKYFPKTAWARKAK